MRIVETLADWRAYRQSLHSEQTLGFVPTMGSLHAGHLSLVQQAKAENALVVVSIFVNPTQFNDVTDFMHYPRALEQDIAQLEGLADVVFYPKERDVYPTGSSTIVEVTGLSDRLLGSKRAGHFRGVTTVVAKLLHLVYPDKVYFGWKDYQQVLLIKRMVEDLFMRTEVHALPTVRDSDGLALSSRNQRLNLQERAAAVIIPQAIEFAQSLSWNSAEELEQAVYHFIAREPLAHGVTVDLRDADTLDAVSATSAAFVLLLAVHVGSVLLIDQAILARG